MSIYFPDNYWPASPTTGAASGVPIRQQILDALEDRLQTILTAGGYNTDLGLAITEWDVQPLDPNVNTLVLDYRDESGTTGYEAVGEHLHTLPVTLRIRCQDNTGAALATVREAFADVYQAIYADVTFGGLAQDANQDGDIAIDYKEAEDRVAAAVVKYVIEYTTLPGNPYE